MFRSGMMTLGVQTLGGRGGSPKPGESAFQIRARPCSQTLGPRGALRLRSRSKVAVYHLHLPASIAPQAGSTLCVETSTKAPPQLLRARQLPRSGSPYLGIAY